jgi:hypothetical protein
MNTGGAAGGDGDIDNADDSEDEAPAAVHVVPAPIEELPQTLPGSAEARPAPEPSAAAAPAVEASCCSSAHALSLRNVSELCKQRVGTWFRHVLGTGAYQDAG